MSGSRLKKAVINAFFQKNIPEKILQFETLVYGFSAALINTPEENLENELSDWLKKIVEFLNVDSCIISEYLDDTQVMHVLID